MGCSSSKPHTSQPYTAQAPEGYSRHAVAAPPKPQLHAQATKGYDRYKVTSRPKAQTSNYTPVTSSTSSYSTSDQMLYIGMGSADTTAPCHSHHSHHHTSHDSGYSGGYSSGDTGGGGYSGGGGDCGGGGGGGGDGGGGGGDGGGGCD